MCLDRLYRAGGVRDVCLDRLYRAGGVHDVCVDTVCQTGGVWVVWLAMCVTSMCADTLCLAGFQVGSIPAFSSVPQDGP